MFGFPRPTSALTWANPRFRRTLLWSANAVALALLFLLLPHGSEPARAAAAGEVAEAPAAAGTLERDSADWSPVELAVPPPAGPVAESADATPDPPVVADATPAPPAGRPAEAVATAPPAAPKSTPKATPATNAAPKHAETTSSAPTPAPSKARTRELSSAIEREIARAVERAREGSRGKANGSNCSVAVHVRELGGAELVARQATRALRPASNMKLVTSATALVLGGPDAAFETAFEAHGEVRGGTLDGDLVARAGADPFYRDGSEGSLDPWLDDLAAQLRKAGIERVTGALVLDEGDFLQPGPGPAWPTERDFWQEYCALSGGFSANAGCITALVRPGAVGAAASVQVRPRSHGLPPKVDVSTGPKRGSLAVAVEARERGLVVRGRIPADVPQYEARFAYPDPVDLCGHALVGGLARRGVKLDGGYRRQRGAPGGERVAVLRTPVADVLAPVLRDSNNSVADQLFLATAHAAGFAGDRDGGFRATRRALEQLHVKPDGLVQVDGSGLSRDDRISTQQLTALLQAVFERGGRGAELLRGALPVAGESGSLEGRMKSGPARGKVRAKTGFIGGTSALSGLVEVQGGRTLVFSILVDYPVLSGLNTSAWKPMQDAICEELVRWAEVEH